MSERRGVLGDLSWIQIIVGALAAMTSAWIASAVGVAGTIIGAALGSLVIPISSALYSRTLDKGRILVVRTDTGTTIQKRVEPGEVTEALEEIVEEAPTAHDPELVDDKPVLRWKAIVATSVAVLVLAFVSMGGYELITDRSWGNDPDNARIGNPFSGGGSSQPTDEPTDDSPDDAEDDATPTPEPTTTATPTPTATTPAPTPTATTSTPTPTATAPVE